MIGPEHERRQDGAGPSFFDSVSIDFCDAEQELFGLVRLTRFPARSKASALAVVCSGGEIAHQQALESERELAAWDRAELDGVRLETTVSLERWAVSLSTSAVELELSIEAITPPLELDASSVAVPELMSGVTLYEQLCHVHGTVHVEGSSRSVRAVGRRVHAWGAHDWNELERWRSLYAASEEGRAISLAAALPQNASGHGQEVHAATLLAPDEEPHAFEDVRVSTVWGPDGLPVKAGLELYLADEEMPRRMAGESVCRTTVDLGDQALGISFFRWSFEGTPALGCYETLTRNP
jgi:hypothetical protein